MKLSFLNLHKTFWKALPWVVCLMVVVFLLQRVNPHASTAFAQVQGTSLYLPVVLRQLPQRIAFETERDGNREIYLMNMDGSNLVNLTNHSAYDYSPAWSPDGERIAFVSGRDGLSNVYVMGADGMGQTRLTDHPASDYDPVWSPDGTKIAFISNRDENNEVYVMNDDGSVQTRLTTANGIDYTPVWSPDSSKIAFISQRDWPLDSHTYDIYVMNADGSAQTRLTDTGATDPAWSPDGNWIAYTDNDHVYIMHPDGSGKIDLISDVKVGRRPAWSPDGQYIAFEYINWEETVEYGYQGIGVMRADGSEMLLLNQFWAIEQGISLIPAGVWSPNSQYLVFTHSACVGCDYIEIVKRDGTGLQAITDIGDNENGVWKP